MKTISIKRNLNIIAIVLSLFLFSSRLSAQAPSCTYTVSNPGTCQINVTVQYYDNTNALCNSASQPISPAGNFVFSCSTCAQPLTNVVVTLTLVNGNTLTSASLGYVDINGITDSGGISGTGCNGQTAYNMSWNVNETVIMY